MGTLAEVKQEWRYFRADAPGTRFGNHRLRMSLRPRWHTWLAGGLGLLAVGVGIILLFIPGPGTLFIGLGLALVSNHSTRLSALLDRSEPRVRRWFSNAKRKCFG